MRTAVCCLAFAFASIAAAGEAPKLEWKVAKGDKLVFTVQRSSTMESSGGQGEFKSSSSSEVEYRIEVAEASGGNLELKVLYGRITAKAEGSRGGGEGKAQTMEESQYLKDLKGKTITVRVKDGKIDAVEGFPEAEQPPAGGQPDFRRFQARRIAGRMALEGDFARILGLAVRGQPLEAGKEYRMPARERTEGAGAGEKGRGRGFGRLGEPRLSHKYTGEEKVDGKEAAAFALAAAPREGGAEGGPPRSVKVEGKALFSLQDGVLLKLEDSSESKSEGERNGQTFKFSSTSKTKIFRGTAKEEPKKSVTV